MVNRWVIVVYVLLVWFALFFGVFRWFRKRAARARQRDESSINHPLNRTNPQRSWRLTVEFIACLIAIVIGVILYYIL
jgi:Ca2+/Na+ antiporter